MPQASFVAPLAPHLLTRDGFCAGLLGLGAADLEREVDAWRRDADTLAKMVHLEIWGRIWFMGQPAEDLGCYLSAAATPHGSRCSPS
jgi:hypothetical protein